MPMSFSDTPMPSPLTNPPEELSAYDPGVFMNLLQHQAIQHRDLMMAIQVQQQEQQALMEMFQIHLQNSAAASVPAPMPIITSTPNPTAKFLDPTAFTGKPLGVRSYIAEIESHFTLFPNQFNNDFAKTTFFGAWLKNETMSKWFMGITHADPALLQSYVNLKSVFEKHFGDVDYVETAHQKLCALKHTTIGKAADYAAKFKCILVDCQHSDYDIRAIFFDNLHSTIQGYLVIDVPNTLEALVSKAIKIDMRLFKMITRKKGALLNLNLLDSDTTSAETKSMTGCSGPAPMEIDALRTSFRTPPLSQSMPCAWLTQDEKDRHH